MNARHRQAISEEGDAEHQLLLSYLISPAWEARLVEARAKRQALIDRLDAGPEQGTARRRPRDMGPAPAHPGASARRHVDAPRGAVGDTSFSRNRAGTVPGGPATRRPHVMPAAAMAVMALSVMALVAGASLLPLDGGLTVPLAPDPEEDARMAAPIDIVTRDAPDTPSPIAASGRPRPAAPFALADVEALAAALEEIGLTNSVTIVASARQADALAGLDHAKAAASVRVTPFELDRSTVSYYHAGDADAAKRLASRLGGETMDLTGLLPTPPDGALSVYLAGN